MNDDSAVATDDANTPANPYSLLAAVNAASRSASRAWLVFLAFLAYVMLAVASVKHRDLLLNTDTTLPVLQVKIALTSFFLFAPAVIVIAHAGLLLLLALLARRVMEFNTALRLLESTDERTHPLRLELDSFFLVQGMAGPERSRVVSAFLNASSWLTLAIMPLLLLFYVQVAFLPFHDAAVTMAHRLALLADVALLLLLGLFLVWPEPHYFSALWRTALHNPGSMAFAAVLLAAAALVSTIATVPGTREGEEPGGLFADASGALFGLFPRNLVVTDANLVQGGAVGARTINLRGRDLRFARLDRSDLHQADLTGANLDGASLEGADLRQAQLGCEETDTLRPETTRRPPLCTSARRANFAGARFTGARLDGIDLRAARLARAQLEGVSLADANLRAADFSHARLAGADLTGAAAAEASFRGANLQGGDLTGAKLQMADFSGASLEAAALSQANLEGASLRDAALDGATLSAARLFGADFSGAQLNLADLSRAMLWRTQPPSNDAGVLADFTNITMRPPSEEDVDKMRTAVERLQAGPAKIRLAALVSQPNDAGPAAGWNGSPEARAWIALASAAEAAAVEGYRARVTEQLGDLACRARFADGAVAAGIARRGASPGFRGDPAALHDRLKGGACAAAAALPERVRRDLAAAAEVARGR